jgi:hypothetical protein
LIDPNGSADDINNVRVANPGTRIPAIKTAVDANQNTRISSRHVEDGSYMRIKNLVLGYTLPKSLISKMHIGNARVYVNIQNLYTFTKYSGFDPEVGAMYSSAMLTGVDFGRYPSQRIYTVGLSIGL